MSGQHSWFNGTASTGDLVTQMHNAAGAFHKELTPCRCTGRLEIYSVKALGMYWVHCHGCSARSAARPSLGEATFEWNNTRQSTAA